jgi:hypothetical protein
MPSEAERFKNKVHRVSAYLALLLNQSQGLEEKVFEGHDVGSFGSKNLMEPCETIHIITFSSKPPSAL